MRWEDTNVAIRPPVRWTCSGALLLEQHGKYLRGQNKTTDSTVRNHIKTNSRSTVRSCGDGYFGWLLSLPFAPSMPLLANAEAKERRMEAIVYGRLGVRNGQNPISRPGPRKLKQSSPERLVPFYVIPFLSPFLLLTFAAMFLTARCWTLWASWEKQSGQNRIPFFVLLFHLQV